MSIRERSAMYPGSFDPPTNGHKWAMERMSDDFDHGIVAVGRNTHGSMKHTFMRRELRFSHPFFRRRVPEYIKPYFSKIGMKLRRAAT